MFYIRIKKDKKNQFTKEPLAEETRESVFERRMSGVLARMYRCILSVDLQMNVYRTEMLAECDKESSLRGRGYYDRWVAETQDSLAEEYQKSFGETFSRQNIVKVFDKGRTCISMVCAGKVQEEQELSWYEFRAEQIPDTVGKRYRCILYVRQVNSRTDDGRTKERGIRSAGGNGAAERGVRSAGGNGAAAKDDNGQSGQYLWNERHLRRLIGDKEEVLFFEYETEKDSLYLHRYENGGYKDSLKLCFLSTIGERLDWLVFHEDLQTVREVFEKAKRGKSAEAMIRYRKDGIPGTPFMQYRIRCVPAEGEETPAWVLGALIPGEGERDRQKGFGDISAEILKTLQSRFAYIYRVDTERDRIRQIRYTDEDGYREGKPYSLKGWVHRYIEKEIIEPGFEELYQDWLEKGFLEKAAASGHYEFESRLKIPGSQEYRWYLEMIFPVERKPHQFIGFGCDVTDTVERREQEYQAGERRRYYKYNQSMLGTMASLVEFRNIESREHIHHVQKLTKIFLDDIAERSPSYALSRREIKMYCEAAVMHDIGKVVIPDHILNKKANYTEEEYEMMKTHSAAGAEIIDRIKMQGWEELKACCRDVALHHHERFDGKGYPDGLVGDEIAIGVQAVSLADVYDALVSERCYKEAYTYEDAANMILNGECGAFNPRLIATFRACKDTLPKIYENKSEENEELWQEN